MLELLRDQLSFKRLHMRNRLEDKRAAKDDDDEVRTIAAVEVRIFEVAHRTPLSDCQQPVT
ncbi:MAG: hypothetical protein CMM26_03515 [Rhodospirillaceae bacterium]|nr:hypothetical protein [Rhodospirillaceae bacterium]